MPPPPPPPPSIRLGPPHSYLTTHGGKVARLHLVDWVVLALLVAVDVGLNLVEPFHRFVGEDMMADLRYPLKSNTVPVWTVPVRYVCAASLEPSLQKEKNRKLSSIYFTGLKHRCLEIAQIYAVIGPIIIFVGIYVKRRNVCWDLLL